MRIAAILGSMRNKGNTEILLDAALDEAKKNGATVSRFILREMDIAP
jgi:multimeric flavodoxin WrbA